MCSLENPTSLPRIDFSDRNLVPNSSAWLSTSKDVVRALEDYGCFIAVNLGTFSLDLHRAIFRAAKELFDLPTHVKVKNTSDTPSHGYVGHVPQVPLYEGLGIEDSITPHGVHKFANLLWPSGNPRFCETALEYSKVVSQLDQVVMRMVSQSYGTENSYEDLLATMSYLLRMIKYRVPGEDETSLGIVPHTDKSFMTILHQRQVPGLQVKVKNCHHWMVVDPSPSSFVVMAGDACMGWTNGRIEPSQHRVIIEGKEERYSIGLFTFIKDVEIKVPEVLVDEEHPLQFKPFDHYKFIHFYYTEEGKRSKCAIKDYCGI